MIVEHDEITGQLSAQFPDIWCGIYPKGHKIEDGKDKFYNGALLVRKGNEHLHLNAFDIGDLLRFLADERVTGVRDNLMFYIGMLCAPKNSDSSINKD